MVVAARVRQRLEIISVSPLLQAMQPRLPALVAGAVVLGLLLVIATSPIGSGDYGQWLMTSRYYLGESVPDYRSIGAVPPVVPMLLAGIRLAIPDPVAALLVLDALLLIGLAASFYLGGALILGNAWAGTVSVVLAFVVTDRFMELFAFGGLLQLAALMFSSLGIAAFARAGRHALTDRRWWVAGGGLTTLAALSHTGTGLIAMPACFLAASLSLLPHRRRPWRELRVALTPIGVALVVVGVYWLAVVIPTSADYVTNPASLAYRGPDRFAEVLLSRWPTAVLFVFGAITILLVGLRALVMRTVAGPALLAAWAAVAWLSLLGSIAAGAATDYPRFATPLLAPLVLSAALGVMWLVDRLIDYLREFGLQPPRTVVLAGLVAAAVLAAVPTATGTYSRQARFYELRDSQDFVSAIAWMDLELGSGGGAILAGAREGKWVEGLIGREALFSQPVRYSFRPGEWQRSVEAEALLRSTATITSGLIGGQFTARAAVAGGAVPGGTLFLSANHGGELVDVLEVRPAATVISDAHATVSAADLVPVRMSDNLTAREATIRTEWRRADSDAVAYTQSVTTWADGSTIRLRHGAPGASVSTQLAPVPGLAFTSLQVDGNEAIACLTEVGGRSPCVRIHASPASSRITATDDGALQIATAHHQRLDVLVTALTAGDPTVELAIIYPEEVAARHDVRAAVLYQPDPAFSSRSARLAAIGFQPAFSSGPYRLLLRDSADPAGRFP